MAEQSEINVEPTADSGAQLVPKYYKATHAIVGVPVVDIEDAANSAIEEVIQFSFGSFLASGSFWLGIERLLTVGYLDTLFHTCAIAFGCGIVLAITGFRQARRRVLRLARYIPDDHTP